MRPSPEPSQRDLHLARGFPGRSWSSGANQRGPVAGSTIQVVRSGPSPTTKSHPETNDSTSSGQAVLDPGSS